MSVIGNETERFIVTQQPNGRYRVRDMQNGCDLRFSYSNPPLYATALDPADEWGNYYAARGFCQKMATKNDPLSWRRAGWEKRGIEPPNFLAYTLLTWYFPIATKGYRNTRE